MPRSNKHPQRSRGGVVLIAVLVCMGVVMTILLGAVQTSLHCRRQMRNEAQLEQTCWLLDAGIRQAIANLEQQPDYAGEQIQLSPAISKYANAVVDIKVRPVKDSPGKVSVLVTAELGDLEDEVLKTKRTKELIFNVRSNQH